MNLIALRGLPIVKKGDDIAQLIAHAANGQVKIENGDIIVVAQSIVSKAEGNVYDLREINPSPRAKNRTNPQRIHRDSKAGARVDNANKAWIRLCKRWC